MKKINFKIILKEQTSIMRIRIVNLLKPLGIELIDCKLENEILEKIKDQKKNICCTILNIETIEGLELVRKIRERNSKIPIVILTSSKKRNFHVQGIKLGVNDFILIPFQDSTLFSKVQRYVDEIRNSYIELVAFNFENYLKGEIRKAQKGNFPLTLMFTTLKMAEDFIGTSDELENSYYSNIYFNESKKLFWKTDILIRFHTRYFLGVFPFCDKKSSQVIENKIKERFQYLIKERIIPVDYQPLIVFSSFPEDSREIVDFQRVLFDKAKVLDKNLDNKWFQDNL